jgi:hypothetical protein
MRRKKDEPLLRQDAALVDRSKRSGKERASRRWSRQGQAFKLTAFVLAAVMILYLLGQSVFPGGTSKSIVFNGIAYDRVIGVRSNNVLKSIPEMTIPSAIKWCNNEPRCTGFAHSLVPANNKKTHTVWFSSGGESAKIRASQWQSYSKSCENKEAIELNLSNVELWDGELPQTPRLLCIVDSTDNMEQAAVWQTWGPECDELVFTAASSSTSARSLLPRLEFHSTSSLDDAELSEAAWQRTISIWTAVYKRYYATHEWFFLSPGSVLLLVPNLRQYLTPTEGASPSPGSNIHQADQLGWPLYIGLPAVAETWEGNVSYNKEGPGYLLNRRGLHVLMELIGVVEGADRKTVDSRAKGKGTEGSGEYGTAAERIGMPRDEILVEIDSSTASQHCFQEQRTNLSGKHLLLRAKSHPPKPHGGDYLTSSFLH